MTLEAEAEVRVAKKASHRSLRLQLDFAHRDVGYSKDDARAEFESALSAYLSFPSNVNLDIAVTAKSRLDAFESLQTEVTSRRDQAFDAGTGL